jgi:hypothetical protein
MAQIVNPMNRLAKLLEAVRQLPFEPHRLPQDKKGRYDLELDREFPLAITAKGKSIPMYCAPMIRSRNPFTPLWPT